jgi:cobalt-zinc-cadmium efflux system outer membrane protein
VTYPCIVALLYLVVFSAGELKAAEMNILTPEQAVGRALGGHPTIAMAQQQLDAVLGAQRAAGQLPNPRVTYGFEALDRGGAEAGEWGIDAQLPVDFMWRRGPRMREALARLSAAEASVLQTRQDLRLEVLSTYVDAFTSAGHARSLATAGAVLAEVARIGQARLQEGDLSDYDVRRIELEWQRVSRAVDRARMNGSMARRRLSVQMGVDPDSLQGLELHADYPYPLFEVTPATLVDKALKGRADMRLASAGIDAGGAHVDRLKRDGWPELQVGLGYKEEDGGASGLTGTVSLDLPLFDRKQGELQEARALQRQAALQATWTRTNVTLEVRSLLERLRALSGQVEALPAEGELSRMLDTARQAYDEGDSDLMTLIDAVQSMTGEADHRWTLLRDYQKTYHELERAIGAPLTEAIRGTEPE